MKHSTYNSSSLFPFQRYPHDHVQCCYAKLIVFNCALVMALLHSHKCWHTNLSRNLLIPFISQGALQKSDIVGILDMDGFQIGGKQQKVSERVATSQKISINYHLAFLADGKPCLWNNFPRSLKSSS